MCGYSERIPGISLFKGNIKMDKSKTCTIAFEIITKFEGWSEKAYPDPATGGEPWTIGWGRTGTVKPGDFTTVEFETEWLNKRILKTIGNILDLVKVPINENQCAAMCSFYYNVGGGNFQSSTLLKKLNSGDAQGAADEFLRWNKANGKVMAGLTNRRTAERTLFLS